MYVYVCSIITIDILKIEPNAPHMLGKGSANELYPSLSFFFFSTSP